MARKQDFISVYPELEKEFGVTYLVRSGKNLHLGGLFSVDENLQLVGENDMAAQIRQIYKRMTYVLSKVDATLENVVSELLFITNSEAWAGAGRERHKIYAEAGAAVPGSTGMQVNGLYVPGAMVEIHATGELY